MAPATEIATIPLAAGANIEDPSSQAGKVWKSVTDTIAAQDGYQRLRYGRERENQSLLQLLVDWDSIDAHKAFMASPAYGPFAKHLMTIVDSDSKITVYHAHLTPHPPTAATTANPPIITEMIECYLKTEDEAHPPKVQHLMDLIEKTSPGYKARATGWVMEEVEHEKFEGKKGRLFLGCLGWENVEAHFTYKETETFKNSIGMLREIPVAVEVHHTPFTEK